MRVNKGRGWSENEPTGLPTVHPPDVRMPYIVNTVSQHSGARYTRLDTDACHIDTTPAELGYSSEADVMDSSRHGGINHWWTAHPHAKVSQGSRPGDHGSVLVKGERWVPDGRQPTGMRLIDIESVTHPHDCENHLPL